jgi:hypothetical protein
MLFLGASGSRAGKEAKFKLLLRTIGVIRFDTSDGDLTSSASNTSSPLVFGRSTAVLSSLAGCVKPFCGLAALIFEPRTFPQSVQSGTLKASLLEESSFAVVNSVRLPHGMNRTKFGSSERRRHDRYCKCVNQKRKAQCQYRV